MGMQYPVAENSPSQHQQLPIIGSDGKQLHLDYHQKVLVLIPLMLKLLHSKKE
jgi:hypothetical protein